MGPPLFIPASRQITSFILLAVALRKIFTSIRTDSRLLRE